MNETKYCKFCGSIIDMDCVVCPKCGKQVEALKGPDTPTPVVINNSANSSSAASSVSAVIATLVRKKLPWYLRTFWIIVLGFFTGGIYWIVGPIIRMLRY